MVHYRRPEREHGQEHQSRGGSSEMITPSPRPPPRQPRLLRAFVERRATSAHHPHDHLVPMSNDIPVPTFSPKDYKEVDQINGQSLSLPIHVKKHPTTTASRFLPGLRTPVANTRKLPFTATSRRSPRLHSLFKLNERTNKRTNKEQTNGMKNTEVSYAPDAEVSHSYDELQEVL